LVDREEGGRRGRKSGLLIQFVLFFKLVEASSLKPGRNGKLPQDFQSKKSGIEAMKFIEV